ncbi:D-amino-acid transaminase [Virgibacillus sp. MSP4-1]|uniref:D-amino-acid transaminase n=1 Tax=Virgibacillus sp. MSP4-1 TaxID=2700081 RepID=UPI0003A43D50|nr:D-amino-acid transaminase [Virgibacillus sp. MSP4-1]QHS21659.1 D-amino-acid transaminase [Virgibacillus sp. MSP4-1]
MFVLKNQEFIQRDDAKTDIEDRGYTFGDGVYEVIRVYNGAFFMLKEHLDRLQFSLTETAIPYDTDSEDLGTLLNQLVSKNQIKNGAIYLQITRGIAPRSHPYPKQTPPQLYAYPIPVSSPVDAQQNGVSVTLLEDKRWLRCDIKSLNLLYNVMAKQQAKENGYFEALLYRDEAHITEGSSSNFFAVKDGTVITHPANNYILNGITRLAVLQVCDQLGIPLKEKELRIRDLESIDEAFLASTTSEVVPITEIDQQKVGDGKSGEITSRILEGFKELIKQADV